MKHRSYVSENRLLAARGESRTPPKPALFRHLCVAKLRNMQGIAIVRRLDLTQNHSLSLVEHWSHGLLDSFTARFLVAVALLCTPSFHQLAQAQPSPAPESAPTTAPESAPAVPAPADPGHDDQRAQSLFLQADGAYKAGNYELALALFRESYSLSQRNLILIAIANTEERLGNLQAALGSLKLYVENVGDTGDPTIANRIRLLQDRIEKAKPPKLVPVDTQDTDKSATPTPTITTDTSATLTQLTPVTSPSVSKPIWPLAIAGGGLVAIAAGTGFALAAKSARNETNSLCVQSDDKLLCPVGTQDSIDRDSRYSIAADIGIGAGIAALITGTVLYMTMKPDETRPTLQVSDRSLRFSLEGNF